MPQDDLPVADPERLRRPDVVVVAGAKKFSAHHAHQRHPAKKDGDRQQPPEARLHDAGEQDDQKQGRHPGPDFDKALAPEVDFAAIVTLYRPGQHSQHAGEQRQQQTEEHRDARTIEDPRQHIAAVGVGAKPVAGRGR